MASRPPKRSRSGTRSAKASKKMRFTKAVRSKDPVPDTYKARMKYVDIVKVTPGIGTAALHIFRANSLYDPDYSSTGHQPLGFDELAQLYSTYRVDKAKITVVGSSEATAKGIVFVHKAQTVTGNSAITDNLELGDTMYGQFGNYNSAKVMCHYDAKKYWGRQVPTTATEALTNTNPANVAYFHVGACMIDDASTGAQVELWVHLEFEVIFSQRVMLHGS